MKKQALRLSLSWLTPFKLKFPTTFNWLRQHEGKSCQSWPQFYFANAEPKRSCIHCDISRKHKFGLEKSIVTRSWFSALFRLKATTQVGVHSSVSRPKKFWQKIQNTKGRSKGWLRSCKKKPITTANQCAADWHLANQSSKRKAATGAKGGKTRKTNGKRNWHFSNCFNRFSFVPPLESARLWQNLLRRCSFIKTLLNRTKCIHTVAIIVELLLHGPSMMVDLSNPRLADCASAV